MPPLPKPPQIHVYPYDKKIEEAETKPFLTVHRKWYRASYPDGTSSAPFLHDSVERIFMDAAVMVVHCDISGSKFLYLRSAIRPAIMNRFVEHGNLWELPAGLIESGEEAVEAAVRETREELGFKLERQQFKPLGDFTFPTVGICSERLFYFEVEVDPKAKKKPTLDGSALERGGQIELISLSAAMRLVKEGTFKDAKTEIGIRRLADRYGK